jgi:hypothetical protein
MNQMLLDLLRLRGQVRFTQSAGNPIGSWPPVAGDRTKCWVQFEGTGIRIESSWQESPEAALAQAHRLAFGSMAEATR